MTQHARAYANGASFWAITCYFNPIGYRRRLENYRVFRQRLAIPLVAVELAYGDTFELGPEDAEILVQLRGHDVMWQKERLLNIAVGALPNACEKVAWVDCDVIFERDEWAGEAERLLDRLAIVQLFTERHDLPQGALSEACGGSLTARALTQLVTRGTATAEDFRNPDAPMSSVGLAWAASREVLDQHGLYDACIMGSGSRAIACAAFGQFDCAVKGLYMNKCPTEHYLRWAHAFYDFVRGRVGYVETRLFHLWHGNLEDRQYGSRHARFQPFAFDPFTDIAFEENDCWRWNSDKQEMHQYVRHYLVSRKEDGV